MNGIHATKKANPKINIIIAKTKTKGIINGARMIDI